jgi:Flp pilus assembly protein TadD
MQGGVATPMSGGRVNHPAQEAIMKPTVLWLSAAALGVTTLIFVLHAQRQPSGGSAALVEPAEVYRDAGATESAPFVSNESHSASQVIVTEADASEGIAAAAAAEKPSFDGGAWQAGVRLYEAGDYEAAVEALEWAVAENEDNAYQHYLLALAYRKAGVPDAAVEEFALSLELRPDQPKAWLNLARAQLDLDLVKEARGSVDQALELRLDDADTWNVLGRVELRESNLDEAAAAFGKAIERDPEHAYAWNNLGYVRILQGRFEDARAPLERAATSGVEEAYFFNNLAFVCEQLDDLPGALAAFARADELGHPLAAASEERIDVLLAARAGEFQPAGPVHASLTADN